MSGWSLCESVKDEFQKFYDEGYDKTSQVVAYVGDRKIVDLFGDSLNSGYNQDSLQNVFSSGKSVASILMGVMVAEDHLDWNAPVTKYWPEWAQNGKGTWLTVA